MKSPGCLFGAIAVVLLALAPSQAAGSAYPGENGPIVYVAKNTSSDGGELFSTSPDGSNVRRLTRTKNDLETAPEVSPNGQWVAYAMSAGTVSGCAYQYGCLLGSESPAGIYVRRLDGNGGQIPITAGVIRRYHGARNPTWSPDGKKLAFNCLLPNGHNELCSIKLDGSGFKVMTDCDCVFADVAATSIEWSPLGDRILFLRSGDYEKCGVWQVAASGGAPTLFSRGLCQDAFFSWAPNGQAVMIESGGGRAGGCCFLEVTGAGGGARRTFTSPDNGDYWTFPSWAPDGTRIVAYNGSKYSSRWPVGLYTISVTQPETDVRKIGPERESAGLSVQPDWGPAPTGSPKLPETILCRRLRKELREARSDLGDNPTPREEKRVRTLKRAVAAAC